MYERIKDVDHPAEQMLSVFRDYGVVTKASRDNLNVTAENRSIYQLVHPGWLVTNRMKAWQGSVGISQLRGIVSGHYICFKPKHHEDNNFLNWLLRSRAYADGYGLLSRGVRIGQAEIDNDLYRTMPVLLPPYDEQRAIADFLDRETAKIDILIEEQQRLVDVLRERRATVAADIFSIDGAAQTPLKWLAADVTVGIVVTPSHWYADSGVPALRGVNVKRGRIIDGDLVYLTDEGHDLHRKSALKSGDVVVVRTGQAGAAAVVPPRFNGANAIDLLIVRPGTEILPAFLEAYLNSPMAASAISEGSVGAIQGHFNVAALRNLSFPEVSIVQQNELVERWSLQSAKIDTLIAETERFVDLSKERRSALITAAVTGQIDVREEAARFG